MRFRNIFIIIFITWIFFINQFDLVLSNHRVSVFGKGKKDENRGKALLFSPIRHFLIFSVKMLSGSHARLDLKYLLKMDLLAGA